jgi:outer membrane protein assembly factor BamA
MIAALLVVLAIQDAAPERPVPQQPAAPERIVELRIHGNATLKDDVVLAMTGVKEGDVLESGSIEAIDKKLRDSGRFEDVEVRKRYKNLAMDEVALLVIVHEKPGLKPDGKPPGAMKRLTSRIMPFPILDYDDGYGWTYGMRTTFVDIAGKGTHLSVPLSWGGTRQAAVQADHTFKSGPFSRLSGSFGVSQRENPHYEIADRRTTLRGRAERRLFNVLTLGAEAARSEVTFQPSEDSLWSGGADVTLDTRHDPSFPTRAVYASAAWSRLNAIGDTRTVWASPAIDRYKVEARGYQRLFRQTFAAVRAQYDEASAPLPAYEQFLLGGSLLRGLDAGELAGDKRFLWGAELRVPFTSPLSSGRIGFNLFLDGGAVAPYGAQIKDQKMYRGAGGGLFMTFRVIQLHFEVAQSLDNRGTHFHFGTRFTF